MRNQQLSNSPIQLQKDYTLLSESLFFRTRNGAEQLRNQHDQVDKVNYLMNDYWDLLFRNKVHPTEMKTKGKSQANEIQSIIISFSKLNKDNVQLVKDILSQLLGYNPSINILLITNNISGDYKTVLKSLTQISLHFKFITKNNYEDFTHYLTRQDSCRFIFKMHYRYIHGKLWLIKYKQNNKDDKLLRVCVATANFSTFDWSVGGNGFWKRDFAKWSSPKEKQERHQSCDDFKNSLKDFLIYALTKDFFKLVSSSMNIDFRQYNFDRLKNVHLIICPPKAPKLYPYNQQVLDKSGFRKIRRIMKSINDKYDFIRSRVYKNINVISPFISTAGQRQAFYHLINNLITAFHGLQPRYNRSSQRIVFSGLNYMKKARIFELTKNEVYLANKYENQTKYKKISDPSKFDLVQTLVLLRRDLAPRSQAVNIVESLSEYVEFHKLYPQQSKYRKYSNFTAHHTKIIACTHQYGNNDSKVEGIPDILFIGSQNFTPKSWGKYGYDSVQYSNIEIGVLIQVPLEEKLTDFIPIKFNTSNFPETINSTKIQPRQIFNLTANNSEFDREKKLAMFRQLLTNDQCCQAYKRTMKQKFNQNALKPDSRPQYKQFQMVIDEPLISLYDYKDLQLDMGSFMERNLFGNKNWFEYLMARLGENFRIDAKWIADIALKERQGGKIRVIWCFQLPTFYTLHHELKQIIDKHIKIIKIDKKNMDKFNSQLRDEQIQEKIQEGWLRISQQQVELQVPNNGLPPLFRQQQ